MFFFVLGGDRHFQLYTNIALRTLGVQPGVSGRIDGGQAITIEQEPNTLHGEAHLYPRFFFRVAALPFPPRSR